jgi:AcrR family transcriptional regulator
MPRHPDPDLEKRILDAAWKLWQGGDRRLSLRTLARAARTNTPAIYRRFKNRREIVRAMLLRLRRDLYEAISSSPTVEAAVAPYLDFALAQPRRYELFFTQQHELRQWLPGRKISDREKNPAFFWGLEKLSQELGGPAENYVPLAIAIWSMVHGTASLLISEAVDPKLEPEMRAECQRTIRLLIRDAATSNSSLKSP